MKKNNQLPLLLVTALLIISCKKNTTPATILNNPACKPVTESTALSGNNATYEYVYGGDGKITTIKKFIGGASHVLQDSIVVGDKTTVHYYTNSSGFPMILTTAYNGSIFDGLPTEAHIAIQEGVVTHTNVFHYFFFYDSKKRLNKVGEQTDLVFGDNEYDLSIAYNDKDNVTALSYEFTTGPRGITTIPASGYDDKPTPFAALKNWPFLMHAAWNNYDPEPLFTALSKNNPSGYTFGGYTRTMLYMYNDKGFPVKRTNTNTTASGSSTFEETYGYQCQ